MASLRTGDSTTPMTASSSKPFDIQDGLGMHMLQCERRRDRDHQRPSLACRGAARKNLGIQHVFQGVSDKLVVFEQLLAVCRCAPMRSAAIGDDLPDLPVLRRCGFAVCVPERPRCCVEHVHYVTQRAGGRGAVRELCELIMAAQGTLAAQCTSS